MYQVIRTAGIWLGTRRKSAHTNTTQMALSMCSSRYCSTFATLFFLYFWAIIVFLDSLTFYFFDIFSSLSSINEVTTENMSLNKKLLTIKRWSCDQFLAKIKFSKPGKAEKCIPSTYLSCWPIHVPSTRCIKWYEQQEYDRNKAEISLNKWKAWPVENSEDVLKIDKKPMTTKRGSCDKFFAKIKISEPDEAK